MGGGDGEGDAGSWLSVSAIADVAAAAVAVLVLNAATSAADTEDAVVRVTEAADEAPVDVPVAAAPFTDATAAKGAADDSIVLPSKAPPTPTPTSQGRDSQRR